jgi:hypothetical protein
MLLSFLLFLNLPGSLPEQALWGYLWQPAFSVDQIRRGPALPYQPQPGDIVFFDSSNAGWQVLYRLAFTGPPTHCGIVLRLPDGTLAILEAGAGSSLDVTVVPLGLHRDGYNGIYVRRRKIPLTPQQSTLLTDFGLAACDKHVSALRFPIQLTPFRQRGPIRTWLIGKPQGLKSTYFCSELVVEACVAAGLLDPETCRPAATYPRDLFFDHSCNWYLNCHLHPDQDWYPPALWTEDGHP